MPRTESTAPGNEALGVQNALLLPALHVQEGKALGIIAVEGGEGPGVLHDGIVPVCEQGQGVDLLPGVALTRRILHRLQHREQILQGCDLQRTDLLPISS